MTSDSTTSDSSVPESTESASHGGRLLIALDIDGTVLREDGVISDHVHAEVRRVRDLGHEVMLATGRSVSMTLPVLDRLELTPDFVVCSNGAITLKRDESEPTNYVHHHVETFNPARVLTTIRGSLEKASYAVEDADGFYRYTGYFPDTTLGALSEKVEFEQLLSYEATRVVVVSPEHDMEEFLTIVEQMGLHRVSYNVGWTAWLDIAPDGVNKATAMERVRAILGIPRTHVMAVGDGRNDIDMLEWAARHGRGVAMGQAPDVVREVANEHTASDWDDGVAKLFRGI